MSLQHSKRELNMILYHRTTRKSADAILKSGFKDGSGTYLTDREWSGVWLSNIPLDCNEGAKGEILLEVDLDLPESVIARYEWIEDFQSYREWLIPAAPLNSHLSVRVVVEADDWIPEQ
jgi:hypothetical protein